ncbi:MAG: GTPase HflX [Deltaproteobacteria bacterium]|nr:GTPase HflX [Deltaproteobacteria bacterium]
MEHIQRDPSTAVLVAIQLPGVDDAEHRSSIEELGRLVETLGHRVVGTISQRRSHLAAAAVLGEGKLRLLARFTDGTGVVPSGAIKKVRKIDDRPSALELDEAADEEADGGADVEVLAEAPEAEDDDSADVMIPAEKAGLVVVDHELGPSQLRNLERATGAQVLDRTAVIVEIFHRHAKSREAKLQVEIARLNYLAPRLRETGAGGDRQRGGIGGKGSGESAVELDRRKIRDRIAELRRELGGLAREGDVRRARRQEQLRVALVGYTNAGKSSLMRALTGSEVYVADKLFATLDTTVRSLSPESRPKVLVSDTVGFIKKLPHDLVASFRSTLDEAREATLLLHVVDASDAAWRNQYAVTREVLGEIEAGSVPSLLVLNKRDRLDRDAMAALSLEYPDAVLVSALDRGSVLALRERILETLEQGMEEATLRVPFTQGAVGGEIHRECRVLEESWDETGAAYRVRALPGALARIRTLLSSAS